jgi:signal transduction histidine kinase
MRRHSKAGDGPRRRKTAPKRSHAPKSAHRRRSSAPSPAVKIARLRRELDEASELQKATSEVLRVIASSTGDLERLFETILANAVRVCDAATGAINRWDGEILQLVATHNMPAAFAEARKLMPYRPDENSASGRLLMHKAIVHIPDLAADRAYAARSPTTVAAVELAGVRTTLAVPMFKDNELVGSFTVGRREVRPFTDKQIEIVQNFAAQAVIAVENARLLNELRQRTDELGRSVADLQRERDNKLMNLEAMAASIGHEVRQPLAGISSNGGAALRFLGHTPPNIEEARLALQRMVKDSHRASQVFDNIRTLFGKADQGHEPIDVNELALGVLQALREELKDHRITTQAELTSQLPFVMGHRGQLQEVFINLVHNAIEAMDAVDGDDRILRVRAERHGGNAIIVAVEDSGPGINPQQLKTIFDAFITTKPNGLGLGLAICRLIIERHKGQLSVAPAEPRGSAFRIVLPAGMPGVA